MAAVPQGQRCYRPSKEISPEHSCHGQPSSDLCASHLWVFRICSAPYLNVATSLPLLPPPLLLLILQLV